MIRSGIEQLRTIQLANIAVDVEYEPVGGDAKTIKAVMGRTSFRATDVDGVWTRFEMRDFIIGASLLGAEPKVGDEIRWNGNTYEVLAPAGEPAWRWSDTFHTAYRIHTKHIAGG